MADNWIAVFETVGGDQAARRVTFDAEDWTFQAAQAAVNEMAVEENVGRTPEDQDYMLAKLYTAEQLAALDMPSPQAQDTPLGDRILKALSGLRQAHNHNRRNAKALKTLEELVPQFLEEYAELAQLAQTMMAAWRDLQEHEKTEAGEPQPSGLVLATAGDIAAVRSRKGL